MDDFSRCTWVYLLKNKSDTQFLLPNFVNMVHTQFNATIKTIRSDNGTEFYLKEFFHSNGILHQLSCVDTPQQNAIVKRKHQHILNVVRALKFQSKVPLCLWGDCIFTVVYLMNRIPSKSLGNKSPMNFFLILHLLMIILNVLTVCASFPHYHIIGTNLHLGPENVFS